MSQRQRHEVEIDAEDDQAKERQGANPSSPNWTTDRDPGAMRPVRAPSPGPHTVCMNGIGNVLHDLLAEIVVIERKLILDLVMDAAGDADAAGLRQSLQPRRHIDSVA